MNRRAFLGSLVGGVAASAAVRTWPFRVFSFPSEIKIAPLTLSIGPRSRFVERFDALYGFGGYFEVEPEWMKVTNIRIPPTEDEPAVLTVERGISLS